MQQLNFCLTVQLHLDFVGVDERFLDHSCLLVEHEEALDPLAQTATASSRHGEQELLIVARSTELDDVLWWGEGLTQSRTQRRVVLLKHRQDVALMKLG